MLPLGDSWAGICLADPQRPAPPDDASLHSLCNLGYSRHSCSRFPPDAGPDAARFAISGDDGRMIRIAWALERDHHPFDHGALEYSRASRSFEAAAVPAALLRQAAAYVASYLRLKSAQPER